MGILARIQRSGIERRSVSFQPLDPLGLLELFGGRPSSSGVQVIRETAITLTPFWRAINLISSGQAKLRCHVFEHDGDDRKKAIDHPAYRLLAWKANPEIGPFTFRQVLQAQALCEGNGYAKIERNGAGEPIALWPLDARHTWPIRVNGDLSYIAETLVDKEGHPVAPTIYGTTGVWLRMSIAKEDMIHIRGLGFDGLTGYRVLDLAKEAIGLGVVQREHESVFFRNHATPRGILQYPATLPKEAKEELARSWNEGHGGTMNAHKTAILDRGMTFTQMSFSAADAQLIQAKEFNILEIANITGVPPHKLGHTARTAYNSLESENQAFLDDCLSPWIVAWTQELWDKLLTEEEKDGHTHTVEFDWSDLVRADTQQRYASHHMALQDGWKCRDEVRGEEGYNPMPDDEGKKFFVPLNVGIVGQPAPGTPGVPNAPGAAPPTTDQTDSTTDLDPDLAAFPDQKSASIASAVQGVLSEAHRRVAKRLAHYATRAAKDGKTFMTWLDSFAEEQRAVVSEMLVPGLELGVASGELLDLQLPTYVDDILSWTRSELLELSGAVKASELEARTASYFESRCGGPGSGVPGPCPIGKKASDADAQASRVAFGNKASELEAKYSGWIKSKLSALAAGGEYDSAKADEIRDKAEKSYGAIVTNAISEFAKQVVGTFGEAALKDPIMGTLKAMAKDSVSAFGTKLSLFESKTVGNVATGKTGDLVANFNDGRQALKAVIGSQFNTLTNAWDSFTAKYGAK